MVDNKVLINDENVGVFVCPKCEKQVTKNISYLKNDLKTIRVKCTCGKIYTVLLERRRFFRKEVSLPGIFIFDGSTEEYPMTVKDLSRSGVKFELPDHKAGLSNGDCVELIFRLDDGHKTLIRKKVFVRSIKERIVGTEFCSRDLSNPFDKAYELAIGFYTFKQ